MGASKCNCPWLKNSKSSMPPESSGIPINCNMLRIPVFQKGSPNFFALRAESTKPVARVRVSTKIAVILSDRGRALVLASPLIYIAGSKFKKRYAINAPTKA